MLRLVTSRWDQGFKVEAFINPSAGQNFSRHVIGHSSPCFSDDVVRLRRSLGDPSLHLDDLIFQLNDIRGW